MPGAEPAHVNHVPRYTALALQLRCQAVNACADRPAAREVMDNSVQRIGKQIAASKAFIGSDLKLIVLPEYFLTGFPMGESIANWRDKACLAMDDAIYQQLGAICVQQSVYLSGNAYETDPHFPELYFQCSFLISDQGQLILRYRRLVSLFAPTPHDVLDRYVAVYGQASLFPVAATPLGRMAAIASEEILYPEIARAHALAGAEIFLHSTSEVGSPLATPKSVAKRARAFENMAYVISANSAGIAGTPIPAESTDGMSAVLDYKGQVLCEAATGESMIASASIDLAALRAWRMRPGMGNVLSRQRLELFAPTYSETSVYPANNLAGMLPERAHFAKTQQQSIEKLIKLGVYTP